MFTTCINYFKPITGTISHVAHWLTSNFRGTKYQLKNPEIQSGEAIAIYCVHGTADRNSAFSTLIGRLLPTLPKQVTYIELVAFNKRAQGKSIEFFAEQLKNKINANPYKNIILMGHSRGGLVASYYAEYLAKEMNVNVLEVICISSPMRGSGMARLPVYMVSSSVNQMQPDSMFLRELTEKIKQSSSQYLYFIGENDHLVDSTKACIDDIKHIQKLKTFDHHAHLSVMTSIRLANSINESIEHLVSNQNKNALEIKDTSSSTHSSP